jgi:hypothetical protein
MDPETVRTKTSSMGGHPGDAWIPMVSADMPWIPKFYSIRNVDTTVLWYPECGYTNIMVSCGQEKYTDTGLHLRDGIGVFQVFSRVI